MSKLIELLTLKAYEVFVSADFNNNFFSGLDMIILNIWYTIFDTLNILFSNSAKTS